MTNSLVYSKSTMYYVRSMFRNHVCTLEFRNYTVNDCKLLQRLYLTCDKYLLYKSSDTPTNFVLIVCSNKMLAKQRDLKFKTWAVILTLITYDFLAARSPSMPRTLYLCFCDKIEQVISKHTF